MTLFQALEAIDKGSKVRLPEWLGYWFLKNGEVKVLTRTGDVENTPWIEKYKDRDDFEITDGRLEFDFALNVLRSGKSIRRKAWPSGSRIKLQTPDKSSNMTVPYLYLETAEGKCLPYRITDIDLLAYDWDEPDGRSVAGIEILQD